MSNPVVVFVDKGLVSAALRGSETAMVRHSAEPSWDAGRIAATVAEVCETFGEPASVVLVVGVELLELARPELPPLAADARRALLLRDADRYFPIAEPVAVSWSNGLAFAARAKSLDLWVRAFSAVCTVDAVVTLPQLCALHGLDGTFAMAADDRSGYVIVIRDGVLADVRRSVAADLDVATASSASPTARGGAKLLPLALPLAEVLRSAAALDVPLDEQFLDARLLDTARRRRATRLLGSAAVLAVAVIALGWAAVRRHTKQLDAARTHVAQLAVDAAPARAAMSRLERVQAERRVLQSADSGARSGESAASVLARVGELLPKDAFVQRLEWDGVLWRIDGSASDAPRIVPLLDADPRFTDVRIVGASTRFIDAGTQRESFSIAFRTRSSAGGARGAQ